MIAESAETFRFHGNHTICCTITTALSLASSWALKTVGRREESFDAFSLLSLELLPDVFC